jgi:hypothetical protein
VKVTGPKASVEVAEGKEEKEDQEDLEHKVAILITGIYQPAVSGVIFVLLSPISVITGLLLSHPHPPLYTPTTRLPRAAPPGLVPE